MQKLLVVLFVVVGVALAAKEPAKIDSHDETESPDRDRLLDNLFDRYKKKNYPDKSTILFGLNLINADFDYQKDILNTDAWLKVTWTDNRLAWDPAKYGGLKNMRIDPDMLWIPDTVIYNGPGMECKKTNAIVYPNGKVLWVPPCSFKTYCNFTKDVTEDQECVFTFGSWTFDGLTMGLDFYDDTPSADVSYFLSQQHKITKNAAIREEKFYPCCVEPYISLKYTLGFGKGQVTKDE